jgi:hypothetical protein
MRESDVYKKSQTREAVARKTQFVWQGSIRLSSLLRHYMKKVLPKHHKVADSRRAGAKSESPRMGAKKTQENE